MDWVRILAYVTGMVDQELLARNEYLATENRILKAHSKGRLQLSDAERATLGEIGHRLGRKVLRQLGRSGIAELVHRTCAHAHMLYGLVGQCRFRASFKSAVCLLRRPETS